MLESCFGAADLVDLFQFSFNATFLQNFTVNSFPFWHRKLHYWTLTIEENHRHNLIECACLFGNNRAPRISCGPNSERLRLGS